MHHLWVALKDPTTACNKQRIARKDVVAEVIRNGASSVSGNKQNARFVVADLDHITVFKPLSLTRYSAAIGGVSVDFAIGEGLEQLLIAAGVIPMMMSGQDGIESTVECLENRRRFTWVDHRTKAGVWTDQSVGVIVSKAGNGRDL